MWQFILEFVLRAWKIYNHLSLIVMIILPSCRILELMDKWWSLYSAYNVSCHVFLLCDNSTFSLGPGSWKTKDISLLSLWSIVPCCIFLEPTVHFSSCLQRILLRFPTFWQYVVLELWPPTLKNYKHISLITVINCTKLYDS